MSRKQFAFLSLLMILAYGLWLFVWTDRIITDPDDQCTDSSTPALARFISCSVEGR